MRWTGIDIDANVISLQFDIGNNNEKETMRLVKKFFGEDLDDEQKNELIEIIPELKDLKEYS